MLLKKTDDSATIIFRDQSLSLREEDESLQTILASFRK